MTIEPREASEEELRMVFLHNLSNPAMRRIVKEHIAWQAEEIKRLKEENDLLSDCAERSHTDLLDELESKGESDE